MEEQRREELRKKREYERKQKEEEQKKKEAILQQRRAKEERILRLKASVDNWGAIRGLPFYFFYYYYPNRTGGISQTSSYARRLIWNFKDGTYDGKAIRILKELIAITFGFNNLKNLTFVCIPASTKENNKIRYERFSRQICSDLGMRNAFPYITINNEKEESHLGGGTNFDLSFNKDFFKDANIILFDDVVTQGHSMHFMQKQLEAIGANVICAISFGRTVDETNDEPHPYTGEM